MQKTSIEWCNFSSNPIYAVRKSDGKRGWACTHASPGCLHCYSETINKRLGTGYPFTKKYEVEVEWRLNVQELAAWFRHKAAGKVFVCDMTDLWHPAIPDEYILSIIGVAAMTPWKTYQLLTKRPERMRHIVETYTIADCLAIVYTATEDSPTLARQFPLNEYRADTAVQQGWPPKNTWWGVSVESPEYLWRINELCQIPAAVRFLSLEPLLAPIELTGGRLPIYSHSGPPCCVEQKGFHRTQHKSLIHWVIVGGESGPGARPCDLAWIRRIVQQCQAAEVKCFVKQFGAVVIDTDRFQGARFIGYENKDYVKDIKVRLRHRKGGDPLEWPEDLRVREFPV